MKNTRKLVFSGIMTALSLLSLYVCSIAPSGKLAIFCLSLCFLTAVVIECGIKYAITAYIAVSVLAFFILANKFIWITFSAFFGYYPVLKLIIERMRDFIKEYLVKVIIFAVLSLAGVFFGGKIFAANLPLWVMGIAVFAGLFVFDLALNLFITFYNERILGKFKI